MQFCHRREICRMVKGAAQWAPFHPCSFNAEHVQDCGDDIRQIGGFFRHCAMAKSATLHPKNGREFSAMQPTMHAAAFWHIRRIKGRGTRKAPFIRPFIAGESRHQIGASCMCTAQKC